jgi:HlyD family secretion protein
VISARGRAAAGGAVLLAAGGWAALSLNGDPPAETAAIHREDLVLTVAAPGELDAVRSSFVGPPGVPEVWDYKINMMIPESAEVKKGDPILGFDATTLEEELRKREVEHAEAIKNLEKKEADLAVEIRDAELALAEAESRLRKETLKVEQPEALKGTVEARLARLDRDLAAKEVEALRLKLEGTRLAGEADREALAEKRDRAAGRIRELRDAIARMTVRAPQDGIVVYQTNWQGDKKKVGDSVWRAEKLMKIPDLSEMLLRAEVDEADAGRLRPGQPATVRVDAIPDAEFPGRVGSIGRIVKRKSRDDPVKVYTAEVALDRTDAARMRPGMRARAEIEVDRVPSALVAPRASVFLREAGPVVLRRAGRGFVETPVTIGRRNARLVEILAGVSERDLVARRDAEPGAARGVSPAGGAER